MGTFGMPRKPIVDGIPAAAAVDGENGKKDVSNKGGGGGAVNSNMFVIGDPPKPWSTALLGTPGSPRMPSIAGGYC